VQGKDGVGELAAACGQCRFPLGQGNAVVCGFGCGHAGGGYAEAVAGDSEFWHGVMWFEFGAGSGCDRSAQDGADFAAAAGDSGRDVTDVVGGNAVSVVTATTARGGADVYSAVLPDADGASCFGEGGGDFGE